MYRLEREDFTKSPFIFLWATLGFQAGFINAFGFLACGRYVSHVTGFGTQIGVALGENKLLLALELIGFPLSFILGAFSSAFFTSARLERKLVPWYGSITGLLPIVILGLMIAGNLGMFGPFGEGLIVAHDFVLLFLLSFACGMQNGCFATMTKGQIRTTHMTGISTDIGTDFARLWYGNLSKTEYDLTKRTNICRIATFMAFTTGSIVSVLVSRQLEYSALVVPMLSASIVWLAVYQVRVMLDQRFKNELNLVAAPQR